jgi:hypothetical protein
MQEMRRNGTQQPYLSESYLMYSNFMFVFQIYVIYHLIIVMQTTFL